ncbi:ribosomal protein S8A, partial [Dispira parvispora]
RSHTGAKRAFYRKKRKFELGRQPANTKLGAKRIHSVRCRGGNTKYRAMRLEAGNYSWGSESVTRKTRIVSVVYNASNNELVRTNTLVKGAIVQIDGTPFRQWYESHYALPLSRKKKTESATPAKEANPNDPMNKPRSKSLQQKIHKRQANAAVESHLEDQFSTGRLFAMITSRPGQSGRADGYILEGKELEFYMKKIKGKK